MTYEHIRRAVFRDRPNRFVAHVEIAGEPVVCHVKNTGRCRELLVPGAAVLVQESDAPGRKTPCDLVAVWKGERLINMDAQAPNRVFGEWLAAGGLGFTPRTIRPERVYGDSRFDFYFEAGERRAFAEIKGVTLEEDGVVRFPDAPTERGLKHLRGLIRAVGDGFDAYAVFLVQMRGVKWFEPNRAAHPAFGDALREARAAGVRVLALDCDVTETSLTVRAPVEVRL